MTKKSKSMRETSRHWYWLAIALIAALGLIAFIVWAVFLREAAKTVEPIRDKVKRSNTLTVGTCEAIFSDQPKDLAECKKNEAQPDKPLTPPARSE